MFTTLAMIGPGNIGLPTATLFASRKKKFIGIACTASAAKTIAPVVRTEDHNESH